LTHISVYLYTNLSQLYGLYGFYSIR